MDIPRYIIRAKPGNGLLYVDSEKGIYVERNLATKFTAAEVMKWADMEDDPTGFTFVNLITGKEYNYYDGLPSDFNQS